MTNLAKLPNEERQRIELDKQAALLVWQGRRGKTDRAAIQATIEQMQDPALQTYFRARLNHYMAQAPNVA